MPMTRKETFLKHEIISKNKIVKFRSVFTIKRMTSKISENTQCSATSFKNNLQKLDNLINICAENHSKSFIHISDDINTKELQLQVDQVLKTIEIIEGKSYNEETCKEGIAKINQILTEEFSDNKIFVISLFPHKSFQILSQESPIFIPPAYDVLKIIYAYTNRNFRQQHFHYLTTEYYNKLKENNATISSIFSKHVYKNHIAFLLSLVKLETVLNLGSNDFEIIQELIKDFYLILNYQRLHTEDVFEVVANKINTTDYQLISYDLEMLSEQRGYLGAYYFLNIKIKHQGKEQYFKFFLKFLARRHPILQPIINRASQNEAFFYEDFMKQLEIIGLHELLTFAPKCYLSRELDLLVLENVKALEYEDIPFHTMLSYEGVKSIVIQIARYHASVMILEETLSKSKGRTVKLNELYGDYFNEYFLISADPEGSFKAFWESIQYFIDKFSERLPPSLTIEEFKTITKCRLLGSFYKKMKPSSKYRNVICHGDLYCSNIALKEDNGAYEACLLDFQTMRYLPPGHDLLFLTYLNTDRSTRESCMEKILDDYYDEVSKCINKLNFDPNIVYPKTEFLNSIDYSRSQALLQAMMYSQVVLAPRELMQDVFGGPKHSYYLFENRIKLVQRSMIFEVYEEAQWGFMQDLYNLCIKEKENMPSCLHNN